MHFIFFRTCDVFEAEETLQNHGITAEIVPTPVQDKAYCGVCINVSDVDLDTAVILLQSIEYQKVL